MFPFTAIVGQKRLKLALVLNAINPKIGGVLIRGTKGTAKSTAVRALADILPPIIVVKSCSFNCDPFSKKNMCKTCQEQYEKSSFSELDVISKPMKVITLPLNATEDRVIGSINVKEALSSGRKILEPGIIARANRNILYIDEVNLLADNVADVLLDSAAMGVNYIEREGISFYHPAEFIIVGTMNPEEGNLRPQFLDRFGLSVDAEHIKDIDKRVQIIKNTSEFIKDSEKFSDKFKISQQKLRTKIVEAKNILHLVEISDDMLELIAKICVKFAVDGHRADLTINQAAITHAAFYGRTLVMEEDISIATKLSLNHRLRRLPFEDDVLNEDEIDQIITNPETIDEEILKELNQNQELSDITEKVFNIKETVISERILPTNNSKKERNTSGQRIAHPTHSQRSKYIGGQKPQDFSNLFFQDIAINETLNKACLSSENQKRAKNKQSLVIKEDDVQIKRRRGKSSFLIIFCIDASGSMGVDERMKAIKGTIFTILKHNYICRDKVSLVVFRKDHAEVVLPPTKSTDLAYKLLKEIPTGGTTPLIAGLSEAYRLAKREMQKQTGYIPLIILLTDARGNVFYNDAIGDLMGMGEKIAKDEIEIIVIDAENSDVKLEISKKFAEASNAIYYHIDKLSSNEINGILTSEGLIE